MLATPGTFGLPIAGNPDGIRSSGARTLAQLVSSARGLVTYWPGVTPLRTSGSNWVLTPAWTLEAWVKGSALTSNRAILSAWAGGNGPMLWVMASNGHLGLHVNGTDVDTGVSPSNGVWYHVGGTYDGTTLAVYLQGAQKATTTGITPVSGSTPLITYNYAASGVADIAASIRDPATYTRALTAAEFAAHYAAAAYAIPVFA